MDYLALIRRADFNDLFKYGKITICSDFVANCSKTKKLTSLNDEPEFIRILSESNNFDNTAAYLIIQYQSLEKRQNVDIRYVKYIYALDEFAKRDFEISFDKRIRIESPIFDVSRLLKQKEVSECLRGVNNVWTIFGLSEEEKQKCKSSIPDSIVTMAVEILFSDLTPSGDLPFWVYLLRYERHSFYPKGTIGYFMDVVHTVCNFKKQETITNDKIIESTQIFQILSQIPADKQLNHINDVLSNDQNAKNFINVITFDWLKTAVIFLLLRDRYTEGLKSDIVFVNKCKELWNENFIFASYLLGIYLGYNKTYDCLYDTIELQIFKKEEAKVIAPPQQTLHIEGEHNKQSQLPPYPFQMQKYTLKGKPSTAKGNAVVVSVNNEMEYIKYKNDNKNVWKIIPTSTSLFSKK